MQHKTWAISPACHEIVASCNYLAIRTKVNPSDVAPAHFVLRLQWETLSVSIRFVWTKIHYNRYVLLKWILSIHADLISSKIYIILKPLKKSFISACKSERGRQRQIELNLINECIYIFFLILVHIFFFHIRYIFFVSHEPINLISYNWMCFLVFECFPISTIESGWNPSFPLRATDPLITLYTVECSPFRGCLQLLMRPRSWWRQTLLRVFNFFCILLNLLQTTNRGAAGGDVASNSCRLRRRFNGWWATDSILKIPADRHTGQSLPANKRTWADRWRLLLLRWFSLRCSLRSQKNIVERRSWVWRLIQTFVSDILSGCNCNRRRNYNYFSPSPPLTWTMVHSN